MAAPMRTSFDAAAEQHHPGLRAAGVPVLARDREGHPDRPVFHSSWW